MDNMQNAPAAADPLGRLKGLGIDTLPELLLYLPRDYKDFTRPVSVLSEATDEAPRYFSLRLQKMDCWSSSGKPCVFEDGKPPPLRIRLRAVDAAGKVAVIWVFGSTKAWRAAQAGDEIHVHGALRQTEYGPQIVNHEFVPEDWRGRVMPIYPSRRGVASHETVCAKMVEAIETVETASYLVAGDIGLSIEEIAERTGINDIAQVLRSIHSPRTVAEGENALQQARLLAALQLMEAAERLSNKIAVRRSVVPIESARVEQASSSLPYALTQDQRKAVGEIVDDLRSPYPMRRLLSGDVGTGKTVTYMIPAVAARQAGASVAILTPNQLLVSQIAGELRQYFPDCPVYEVKKGDRGKLPADAILVGTTALLKRVQKDKLSLNLVVVDEQHKLSQGQREALVEAGTNLLEATATAIPRSLALVTHGGMDVSVLRECPVEKRINTGIVPAHNKGKLLDFIRKVAADGGQVAVIYPLVANDKDDDPVTEDGSQPAKRLSVAEAAIFWEKLMPGRVGVLHGKMEEAEKADVIERMKRREFDVLVSSSVIEIGITLPDLRSLVVYDAEGYGVAQLHQMRGRVARHGGGGAFLMYLPRPVERETMERLQLLVDHRDGFALAEQDMEQRGFGDLSGELDQQAGRSRTLFIGLKLMPADVRAVLEAKPTRRPAPKMAIG